MENIFSHEGHLKGGFAGAAHPEPWTSGRRFVLEVGDCRRVPETPMAEARAAARQIAATTTAPIWLCLSGGVDSESMALAFLAADVPFQVAILRFAGKLNWFDIRHALKFCRRRRIPYRIFDLDLDAFYDQGTHVEFAHKYRCVSPQLAAHLYLLSQIPGFPVLSWNAPHIEVDPGGKMRFGFPSDLYFCYHRFFERENKPGVAFFFLYTPELVFSFLRNPRLQDLIFQRAPPPEPADTYRFKCQIYQDGGFDIRPRSDKFTGFEQAKRHFKRRFGEDLQAFDRHFRWPLEKLYPRSDDVAIGLSKKYLYAGEGSAPGEWISAASERAKSCTGLSPSEDRGSPR